VGVSTGSRAAGHLSGGLTKMNTIRAMYPLTLLAGQGMGTAYEYYSKLRVIEAILAQTGVPRSMVAVGLPEKHGYDMDLLLLAHWLRGKNAGPPGETGRQRTPFTVCEDRAEVLDKFQDAIAHLADRTVGDQLEIVHLASLSDWRALDGRRFDWLVSTASVQRLPDEGIVVYLQQARQIADYALLFIPNSGNRAHLTLSGLRGLDLDETLALCHRASGPPGIDGRSSILAAGYCDIPPFPPGLQRSSEAKERALHSPLESLAMWGLEWWCRGERLMPRYLQERLAHLVYVALDLRADRQYPEDAA